MYLSMKASIVLSTSRHFGHTLERFFRLIMEQLKCSYVAVYIPTVDPSLMQRIDLNARKQKRFFIFIDADCVIHDVIPMAVPGEFWLA